MADHQDNHSQLDFLSGGGEMGELIRAFDWKSTSLGSPENWQQSLKTCVRIMLTSSQPIWIGWGPELIKLYNDSYISIVGGKHPWALGSPVRKVWSDIWSDIEPLLKKVIGKNEGIYVESQLLIMERHGYPEETYYTFSYSPVPGDDGKTAGVICYNTQDTEMVINERALNTLRGLGSLAKTDSLEELFPHIGDTLVENDKDFPYAVISMVDEATRRALPRYYCGIEPDHPDLPAYIDLSDPEKPGKFIRKAFASGSIQVADLRSPSMSLPRGFWSVMPDKLVHIPIVSSGSSSPLAVLTAALNPYRKFDETFRNFIQLIRDQVTLEVNNVIAFKEEKKRAEALAEIDRAKTAFFTNISHEFRTPLTLMLGPLEEMLNRPADDFESNDKASLETAHRNALRLLKLVNSLLDFSRIESGRQKANFILTDVAAYTRNLAGNFRSVIEKAGLTFEVHVADNISPQALDREMWEKIVFNLLSNAFKYTLKGKIVLRLFIEDSLMLSVEDTGVGIPEEELPNMFARFHRVQAAHGRTFEGTGIGLSLIKELVNLHKGQISVKSKLGEGSVFIVKIPLSEKPEQQAVSPENFRAKDQIFIDEADALLDRALAGSEELKSDIPTILVVDDNADMREHIKSLLKPKFNVILARHGEEALAKMGGQLPDLVLSDVMMPVMDGIELLKNIKSHKLTAQIPVILLTARAGEESKIEGLEIGADDYLVKPFSSRELVSRITSQVEAGRTRRENELFLHNLFLQSPAAIAVLTGPEHIFTVANPLYQQMVNRTEGELIGKSLGSAFPELDKQGIVAIFDEVYKTGKTHISTGQEIYFDKSASGQRNQGYFNFVAKPLKNLKGNVDSIMVHAVDITESFLANKRIAENEQNVRSLFLQTPIGIATYRGEEHKIELVNDTMLRYWGKTQEDAIGVPLKILLPDVVSLGFDKIMNEVYRSGITYESPELLIGLGHDGAPSEKYFRFAFLARKNDRGETFGILGIATDISDQVMSRKNIEQSEKELRELANAMPQLVWIAEPGGKVIYYNEKIAEFAGASRAADGQWYWEGIVHEDDLELTREAWTHSVKTGEVYEIEHRIKRRDGSYHWYLSRALPQRADNGNISRWFGTATDINAQKLHEKRKDDFIQMASHELKTPITVIKAHFQMLQERLLTLADQRITLSIEKMDRQLNKLTGLISDLLDVSRIESGKLVLDKTLFDIGQLLTETIEDLRPLSPDHKLMLNVPTEIFVNADRERITQVIVNFVTNSIKYSPNAKMVRIGLEEIDSNAVICVQDFGIGILKSEQKKIFDNFYRVSGNNRETFPGFGIGLFVVKEILRAHGGTTWVDSEPGKGSTFFFSLPKATN